MSKPLELTIYPAIPPDPYESGMALHNEPEVLAWEGARYEEDVARYHKRLMGSELAAEVWHERYNHEYVALMLEEFRSTPHRTTAIRYWADQLGETRGRIEALQRFATLPDHDE